MPDGFENDASLYTRNLVKHVDSKTSQFEIVFKLLARFLKVSLPEKTGQDQKIEVGRLPSSFHNIKAIRKD